MDQWINTVSFFDQVLVKAINQRMKVNYPSGEIIVELLVPLDYALTLPGLPYIPQIPLRGMKLCKKITQRQILIKRFPEIKIFKPLKAHKAYITELLCDEDSPVRFIYHSNKLSLQFWHEPMVAFSPPGWQPCRKLDKVKDPKKFNPDGTPASPWKDSDLWIKIPIHPNPTF